MSRSLEDLGAPPRSTGSLVRSFIGSWLRELDGWVAVGDLVRLIELTGASGTTVRSAVSRLKAGGVLSPREVGGVPGYQLADGAAAMLARGDRRIFDHRPMAPDDQWMLVLFSVPEHERQLRRTLRQQLAWLGCGSIGPGAWIGPGHRLEETRDTLRELGLSRYATLARCAAPLTDGPLREAVARWWDLPALNQRYAAFVAAQEPVARRWRDAGGSDEPALDERAFVDHLLLVDDWRGIPYLDPLLPPELLPGYWRGAQGAALFEELHARLRPRALRYLEQMVCTGG